VQCSFGQSAADSVRRRTLFTHLHSAYRQFLLYVLESAGLSCLCARARVHVHSCVIIYILYFMLYEITSLLARVRKIRLWDGGVTRNANWGHRLPPSIFSPFSPLPFHLFPSFPFFSFSFPLPSSFSSLWSRIPKFQLGDLESAVSSAESGSEP